MEKRQRSSSGEPQCVGKLKIVKPKPVGFLCGSIPVPTDNSFHDFNSAALVPSPQPEKAPRYRMIPPETDLNTLPLLPSIPNMALPIGPGPTQTRTRGSTDTPWENGSLTTNLTRKGETLAVSGLVEHGDDLDIIAPADILKQIFKIPYSKARLSIAVHRVGQTLVLNTGPDVEEGEELVRRHKKQSKCSEQSLFLNFAMHSVRMEACDCPPTYNNVPHQQSDQGSIKTKQIEKIEKVEKFEKVEEKVVKEKQNTVRDSENHDDNFLRVLFWQFHNFRMLLGSDLLIFSNDKYVAVSLHLWDVSQQVTPLTWLEAWLDNVMASVPELAICYHNKGVVQGYELLKTDDILILKGISEDGLPAFHPHVVRQNGLSVLRFLQENCKQDPGAYWLYKSAGEDVIQLFDLSVIPTDHTNDDIKDGLSSLPVLINKGRSDSLVSLGTLLYRIAHRLSLSMSSNNRAKCARFFRKCLDYLDEPDYLVVRASAHEQFARLLLTYEEDLEITPEVLSTECTDEESFEIFSGVSELTIQQISYTPIITPKITEKITEKTEDSVTLDVSSSSTIDSVVENVADPISSKLAAVHHVSQAIKSIRFKRQLQNTQSKDHDESSPIDTTPIDTQPIDLDCFEVYDILKWLPNSKLDDKLWKLVLLLGESYLALGEAYKEDNQLHRAMKVIELASLVYGSMPLHVKDSKFISSMVQNNNTIETYMFWYKAWSIIGDIYVEFHKNLSSKTRYSNQGLKMSSEVVKEVERLRKKLGQFSKNCVSCSLINCSCQSDRASSGSSASSSSYKVPGGSRKLNRKVVQNADVAGETKRIKNGGIFKYIRGSNVNDVDSDENLLSALSCYEGAEKALSKNADSSNADLSEEMKSVVKKKGWVCNELGRKRIERKDIEKAEISFSEAIIAFKEVSDFTNVIIIYCNLGHGKRALAEEMLEKFETLKMFQNSYKQVIESVKIKYSESIKFYGLAKVECEKSVVSVNLRNEVYTQYAHTYLRLGMFLAKEDTYACIYENGKKTREITVNDAIREALSVYESLGDLRKQEMAYAYFQLACYQRDCCLKIGEKSGAHQRVKQYGLLADRNWHKAMDFYQANVHPVMYLTILIERSCLLIYLSSVLHSNMLLDTALTRMLEGRNLLVVENLEIGDKFWSELQKLLKKMLSIALSSKSCVTDDIGKLKELYKMSLKCTEFSHLHEMYRLWTSGPAQMKIV